MRIDIIDENGKSITIRIPTRLLLNRFTAAIAPRLAAKCGRTVTTEQARKFIKVIHECRRIQGGWNLAEIVFADSRYVKITL